MAKQPSADPQILVRRVGLAVVHALKDGADAETMQALQAREARALNALPKQPGYTPTLNAVYVPPVKKTRKAPAVTAEEPTEQPRKTRQPKQTHRSTTRPRTRRHSTPPPDDILPPLL